MGLFLTKTAKIVKKSKEIFAIFAGIFMAIFTDTHTHLYADEFSADREQLIREAIGAGVTRFFMPNIEAASIEGMLELEQKFPEHCFPMMGLHPCSVKENWEVEMKIVEDWLAKRKNRFDSASRAIIAAVSGSRTSVSGSTPPWSYTGRPMRVRNRRWLVSTVPPAWSPA